MATIKERLLKYLNVKRLSKRGFEKSLGAANGLVDNFDNPTAKKLTDIIEHYPDLSLLWLVLGVGKMDDGNNPPSAPAVSRDEYERVCRQRDQFRRMALAALEDEPQKAAAS